MATRLDRRTTLTPGDVRRSPNSLGSGDEGIRKSRRNGDQGLARSGLRAQVSAALGSVRMVPAMPAHTGDDIVDQRHLDSDEGDQSSR